jgi:cobaltochelatase CobN
MVNGMSVMKITTVSMIMLALVMTTAMAAPGNKIVFMLGTDVNNDALQNAASNNTIASELDITIFGMNDTVAQNFNFPDHRVIFIESQDETLVAQWSANITAARQSGSVIIGYNLSPSSTFQSNTTLSSIDLRSSEYTDIERYWVQGGDSNMENMLKFMGQKFCDAWSDENIPEPELLRSKINITYITNYDIDNYYLIKVAGERSVIKDRFDVTVFDGMDGKEIAANLAEGSEQDVIILGMISADQLVEFKDVLLAAKDNGTQIGLIATTDVYGIETIKMDDLPHCAMKEYHDNGGYTNMENWIRGIGVTLEGAYIEYAPALLPSIPDHGIYHPDAFPMIFENITKYIAWYTDHGYNASAPTIGIIANELVQDRIYYSTENAIIRYLESKGCNVIYTTKEVCSQDMDHFIMDGNVLVDSIISLNAFYLNYDNQEQGVEYLKSYNVPVLKGVLDPYSTPDMYNVSQRGLDLMSIAFQVTQPEIDGCIDYVWIAGKVNDPATGRTYYEPVMPQVDWLCDRAISWANLGRTNNADKKVSILYYNHEGGKDNIGASYLDISSSFTLLLEQMRMAGYNTGSDAIPNGSEFIGLFIESRNVGLWAPGELENVVNSGNVTLVAVDEYLSWYNNLPVSMRTEVEARWGEAPGNIMVYKGNFVIPTLQFGNINFIPQPARARLSDESLIYHNKSIPPNHQYLATYFWINNIYDADAIIHFGTHGTQEWLPGKEVGLWRYDYPSIMVDDTPVVYPYIMDNVGEGTQAKRRGNAVIIDHLTPPIVDAGIYGDLATMHEKIHNYEAAAGGNDIAMMALYRNSTIELYKNLTFEHDLDVTPDELRKMADNEFKNFIGSTVHDYLHKLQSTSMPLGLHTFGVAPENEKQVCMVKSMLCSDFIEHIVNVIPKDTGDEEDWEDAANVYAIELLNATLLNRTTVSTAQLEVLNLTDPNITEDLNLALDYSALLGQTTHETDQVLHALNAGYIEPGPGNDPVRNPETLPTGRNFYSFDQRKFPDEETAVMGEILADEMVQQYYTAHNNTYPDKVTFVLWSVETMRHRGLVEAQIYSLLGVEPVRSRGLLTGFKVIPPENMNHPRIDVVITTSGLYRDTFPYQIELIDEAVRTVAALNEASEKNYIRRNSLKMENTLITSGYNNTAAQMFSQSRIFSESPGSYGTGLPGAVTASETWESDHKLADLYISRMSSIYGLDNWGESYEDVFRMNLKDIDAAIHSDSSNLFGVIDNDDYYQYLGGIGLAVRSLTGEDPEMYVANLESMDNPRVIILNEAFRTELRARYFNPKWTSGMMEYDYSGAREFAKFTEHMWGWDVMTPDMVTDSDWDEMYNIYVSDKYDLGTKEFFNTSNPYAYQSMTARMLETTRKGYWDASDEVIRNLAKEYVESVVENGVTCCHHTCGNPLLDEYVQGLLSVAGVSEQDADTYRRMMDETTHRAASGKGVGDYVEGYEMQDESTRSEETGPVSFSGSDIMGLLVVLLAVGAIYVGFRKGGA